MTLRRQLEIITAGNATQVKAIEQAFLNVVKRTKPIFEKDVKDNIVREAVNDYYDNLVKEIKGA